jgi:ribosome-associated translation inhibitor RaiA
MKCIVSFKGMPSNKELKSKIIDKMNLLKDHLRGDAIVTVTVWEYDKKKVIDGFIRSGNDKYFAKIVSYDFLKSIEELKDKLKVQILKSKNYHSQGDKNGKSIRYE